MTRTKRPLFVALSIAYMTCLGVPALAEDVPAPRPGLQKRYDNLSEEQKAKIQEKKEIFESLPPEEQQAIVDEAKKKVADFQSLSPEEKQAAFHEAAAKRYEGMTDEQKAQVDARRTKVQNAKAKYDSLSDEEKAQIKEKRAQIKEKRAANGGGNGERGKRFKEKMKNRQAQ